MNDYSIIIPTYNCASYITEAVESVLEQDVDKEIIVIDDGSTDYTKDILKPYMSRIKYISQNNQGPGSARNVGIKESKSKWIAFLDSDDVFLSGYLQHHNEFVMKHRTCKAFSVNFKLQRESEENNFFKAVDFSFNNYKKIARPLSYFIKYNFSWLQNTIINRELIEKHRIYFNTTHNIHEDFRFLCELALQTSWFVSDRVLVYICRRKGLVSNLSKNTYDYKYKAKIRMAICKELIKNQKATKEEKELLRKSILAEKISLFFN